MSVYKTGGLLAMLSDYMGYSESTVTLEPSSTPYSPAVSEPRAYHAGGMGAAAYGYYGGGLSSGAKYFQGLSDSGAIKYINHYTTRRNARAAYHDVPQARSIVERMADTIADIGLRLEAVPAFDVLGISQEEAREWAQHVETRLHLYAMDKNQHRSGTMTWYQTHRLYQIFQHRDNDQFIRLFYNLQDRELQNPLQFEFLDPDQIRGHGFTSTAGFNAYVDGIERDERGRETVYKVWIRKKGKRFEYEPVEIPARGSGSKKIFMLHGFTPEYAGQGRGYSRLHFALQEFQNITDFSLAHIKKAINESSMFLTVQNKDLAPGNPMEGNLTNAGVGPAAEQFGTRPSPSADAQNVTGDALMPPNCYSVPEATIENPGSFMVVQSQKGDEMKLVGGNAPSANYDKFLDSFTSYISAATGMPVEVVLMRFNQNYSASRGALILFWRVVEMWRHEMAADYLNPFYAMWMANEIALGEIRAPGFADPRLRRAWLNANWIGMPLPDIDPSKTAKAMETRTKLGHLTGKRGAREFNGSSFELNKASLTREYGEPPPPPWKQGSGGALGGNPDLSALAEYIVDEIMIRQEDK
jgi:capsid protein